MYLCIYLYINDLQMISIKYKSLNKNEIQPSKYIPKNYNPVFLDSVSFFEFVLSCCVWKRFVNFTACIQSTLFFIVYKLL